jgi:hypothetical protein
MLAHIAGIPVEETVLGFAPLAAIGIGALGAAGRRLSKRVRPKPPARAGAEVR